MVFPGLFEGFNLLIGDLTSKQSELSGTTLSQPIGSILMFLLAGKNHPPQSLTCLVARTALI